MPTDKKILDRVEKLLRLAAPSSNTTEHEQISAALEAAKIISENNLIVQEREVKRKRSRSAPQTNVNWSPTPVYRSSADEWRRYTALYDAVCADPDCQGPIEAGEDVWARLKGNKTEYLHDFCPMAPARPRRRNYGY